MAASRPLSGRTRANRVQPSNQSSLPIVGNTPRPNMMPPVSTSCRVHRYCSEQIKQFKTKADMFFLWACGAFVIFVGAVILAVRFASEELRQVNALGMTIYVLGLVSITVGGILIVCGVVGLVKRRMKLKKLYGNHGSNSLDNTQINGRTNLAFNMDVPQNETSFCINGQQQQQWMPYGGTTMPMIFHGSADTTQQFFSVMVQPIDGTPSTGVIDVNNSTASAPPPYTQINVTFPLDKPPDYEDISVEGAPSRSEGEHPGHASVDRVMDTSSNINSPNTTSDVQSNPVDVIPREGCSNVQTVPDIVARF